MRLAIICAAFLAISFGVACAGGDSNGDAGGKLSVVATTTQIGDFAREVGGEAISLNVLLKPNEDAHDFEPKASQSRAMSRAAVVLRNGIGLDDFVEKAIEGSQAKAVTVTSAIKTRSLEGEEDAHVWFSVANAKLMVAAIRDALVAADATNATIYRDNAQRYTARLDELEAKIKADVASIPQACRKLVTNHDVLGYYADAYGFTLVGSVIPSTSTEARASAADIAQVVSRINAERVPAIFAEASVNPALVRQVGREAGVKVVDDLYGDSLGPKGSDGATYIGMMETDSRKIAEALKTCS